MHRTDLNTLAHQHTTRGAGRSALVAAMLSATMLWACGGSEPESGATVHGVVTDQDGTQKSALGGQGTLASATEVRASRVQEDGSLELLAEAEVGADGAYQIVVPAGSTHVLLQAVDAAGEVVASTILDAAGAVGSEVIATPMDTESSVEAEVFLAMSSLGVSVDQVNTIDLRSRIDQATAVAVRAVQEAGEAQEELAALAQAIATAQAAEIQAYADAGVSTSQQALFAAELEASQTLSAALHNGEDLQAAYTAFFAGLAEAAESIGADARDQSGAEAAASMSFRLTMENMDLGAEAQEVVDAAVLMAAALEAWMSARAVDAILEAGDAAADIQDAALAAGDQLVAEIAAATTLVEARDAFDSFSAAFLGETTVESSIFGSYLGVDQTTAASVDVAIDSAWSAATALDEAVTAAVQAAFETGSAVDPEAVAQLVAGAWSDFRAALQAVISENQDLFGEHADTSMSLMIEATGGFRASSL